jgi:catechol 2,3-dioxygenase-like lactoylglutathione lyase family enzyme
MPGEKSSVEFTQSTPVLMCSSYPVSRDFYVDKLGFGLVEEGGDPPRFGIFRRGRAILFLDAWHGARAPAPQSWDAYFHVTNGTVLAAEFGAAGADISKPLHDAVYGMREFEVTDPDGNVLCFGEDLDD